MTREVEDEFTSKRFTNSAKFAQPPLGGPSEKQLKKAKEVLEQYDEAVLEQKRETLLLCSCGAYQKLSDSELVQTHWYEGPHGCMGGDTWHPGECQVVCNTCDVRMRLNFKCEALQDWEWRKAFKEVLDCHDR